MALVARMPQFATSYGHHARNESWDDEDFWRDDEQYGLEPSANPVAEDHLLKTTSAGPILRDRNVRSSSTITNPYEDVPSDDMSHLNPPPVNRPGRAGKWGASPTPSLRRGKAEQLLKDHGSPPGIRVTAGGRIVPDTLSPLASPRFDGFKPGFARQLNYGGPVPFYNLPRAQNGAYMDGTESGFGPYLGGDFYADGHPSMNMMHVFVPQGSMQPAQSMLPLGPLQVQPYPAQFAPPQTFLPPNGPGFGVFQQGGVPTERELAIMETHHADLERELKELNKNEVLQRASMTQKRREEIVKKRVELTHNLDENRIRINSVKKALDQMAANGQLPPSSFGVFVSPQQMQASPLFNPAHMHFQPGMDDVNTFAASQQRKSSGPTFQPDMPEFVPRQFKPAGTQRTANSANGALQERAINVVIGSGKLGPRSSMGTGKDFGSDGMGLDGSATNPRRSRAVPIKDPKDHSTKEATSLDPASPGYKSQGNTIDAVDERYDRKSPIMSQGGNFGGGELQNSSSPEQSTHYSGSSTKSVATADFFPASAHEHSQRRAEVGHMKHPSWMPKEGEPKLEPEKSTPPSRLPNKFVFPDDSPADRYYSTISSRADSPMLEQRKANEHGNVPTGLGSAFDPARSPAYWTGYNAAVKLDLIPNDTTEDFRMGYRDAMIQARTAGGPLSRTAAHSPAMLISTPTVIMEAVGIGEGDAHFLAKGDRALSSSGFTSPSTVPEAPVNSLATTPIRALGAKIHEDGQDLTIAEAASTRVGNIGSSSSQETVADEVRRDQASPAGLHYISEMLSKEHARALDQQRYVQTANTAIHTPTPDTRGTARPQFDGSATGEDETFFAMPTSPTMAPLSPTSQARKTGGSPRRMATAAVATMIHAAGIITNKSSPSKNKQEVPKNASPEKKPWHNKLVKGFR